jgi:hypothetical protein
VGLRWLQRQGPDVLDEQNAWILKHPIKAALIFHHELWLDPCTHGRPMGGLPAWLGLPRPAPRRWRLWLAMRSCSSPPIRCGSDQWAAPALALACAHGLPSWALPFIALSIVFNPWKGSGV